MSGTPKFSEDRALIVGGGIGGLATGIALARRGIAASLFERATFGDETGAGIQLGPNATRILRDLGALDAVEAVAFKPEAVILRDGMSGDKLAALPLGDRIEERFGAPYLSLHRADLHASLLRVLEECGIVALNDGFPITSVTDDEDRVVAHNADGAAIEGSCLIAADGLWSSLRQSVAPNMQLRFSGATAWRAILPRAALGPPFDAPHVGLWLGPGSHLVHYPVRRGGEVNIVAVVEGGEAKPGWNREAEAAELLPAFAKWAKPARDLLYGVDAWRCWSLYRLPSLNHWSAGRVTLLGDAAHPVLPFLAQGGALAIEDAAALAGCLAASAGDAALAFRHYETLRRARATRVQSRSRRAGFFYHLRGPLASIRNALLRLKREQDILEDHAWLYGASPEKTPSRA